MFSQTTGAGAGLTLNAIYREALGEPKHRFYLQINASFIVSCVSYAYVAPHIKCDENDAFPLPDCIQTMSANLCGDMVSHTGDI